MANTSGCIPQRNRGSVRLLPVVSAETPLQTRHHAKNKEHFLQRANYRETSSIYGKN